MDANPRSVTDFCNPVWPHVGSDLELVPFLSLHTHELTCGCVHLADFTDGFG